MCVNVESKVKIYVKINKQIMVIMNQISKKSGKTF